MFKSLREANDAFIELMRRLPREVGRPADHTGAYELSLRWVLGEGIYPVTLEIRRGSTAPPCIELTCGDFINVTGSHRGHWFYFCEAAMPPGRQPLIRHCTVFPSFEEMVAAVIADVRMYLDGSYESSDVRPRSLVKR